jgi:TPR repeat protein
VALIRRGDQLLATGDIAAARSAYERAAAGGNRVAAIGVAKTYDPVFLLQAGVRGLKGDPQRAALWYGKAAAAGDREAQQRLRRLRAQFPQ